MPFSFHKEVTSPEALASSLETDHHVLRWFTLLVVHPAVINRSKDDPALQPPYRALKGIIAGQSLLFILLWSGALVALYLGLYNALWAGLIFFFPLLYLHQRLKQNVKTIAMKVVLKDFDPVSLKQKTLYQISEFYGRQYQIPSLVDNIFRWDNASRIAVITIAILAIQMIPLILKVYRVPFLLTFILLLGTCYLIFLTIHTWIIFKYLQSPLSRK